MGGEVVVLKEGFPCMMEISKRPKLRETSRPECLQSPEAEVSVLAGALVDPSSLQRIKGLLTADMFASPARSTIYRAIQRLSDRSSGNQSAGPMGDLRRLFDAFVSQFPLARTMLRRGEMLEAPKGAPLRCGLREHPHPAPRVIAVSECVGSTYPRRIQMKDGILMFALPIWGVNLNLRGTAITPAPEP